MVVHAFACRSETNQDGIGLEVSKRRRLVSHDPFPNFLAPLPIELAPQGYVLVKTRAAGMAQLLQKQVPPQSQIASGLEGMKG